LGAGAPAPIDAHGELVAAAPRLAPGAVVARPCAAAELALLHRYPLAAAIAAPRGGAVTADVVRRARLGGLGCERRSGAAKPRGFVVAENVARAGYVRGVVLVLHQPEVRAPAQPALRAARGQAVDVARVALEKAVDRVRIHLTFADVAGHVELA